MTLFDAFSSVLPSIWLPRQGRLPTTSYDTYLAEFSDDVVAGADLRHQVARFGHFNPYLLFVLTLSAASRFSVSAYAFTTSVECPLGGAPLLKERTLPDVVV